MSRVPESKRAAPVKEPPRRSFSSNDSKYSIHLEHSEQATDQELPQIESFAPSTVGTYLREQVAELTKLSKAQVGDAHMLRIIREVLICMLESEEGRVSNAWNVERVAAAANVSPETIRRRYRTIFPNKAKHTRILITSELLPALLNRASGRV